MWANNAKAMSVQAKTIKLTKPREVKPTMQRVAATGSIHLLTSPTPGLGSTFMLLMPAAQESGALLARVWGQGSDQDPSCTIALAQFQLQFKIKKVPRPLPRLPRRGLCLPV